MKKPSFWKRDYSLKGWVVFLVTTVLVVGFIFPLFAEVILGSFFPSNVNGVETWNQFTSIILGIIATVLSLVSMFMGFKSYDDSVELQKTCVLTFDHIKSVEQKMDRMGYFSHETAVQTKTPTWNPENIEQREE